MQYTCHGFLCGYLVVRLGTSTSRVIISTQTKVVTTFTLLCILLISAHEPPKYGSYRQKLREALNPKP